MEQEKLSMECKERQMKTRRVNLRVSMFMDSGGLTRSSEKYLGDVFGNLDVAKGLAYAMIVNFANLSAMVRMSL